MKWNDKIYELASPSTTLKMSYDTGVLALTNDDDDDDRRKNDSHFAEDECRQFNERALIAPKMENESPNPPPRLPSYECVQMIQLSERKTTKRSDFSIDFILGNEAKAPQNFPPFTDARYDWLNYTRYKPPKLPSTYL